MDVGGQRHTLAALPPGKRLYTHSISGWVGPRAVRTFADNLAFTPYRIAIPTEISRPNFKWGNTSSFIQLREHRLLSCFSINNGLVARKLRCVVSYKRNVYRFCHILNIYQARIVLGDVVLRRLQYEILFRKWSLERRRKRCNGSNWLKQQRFYMKGVGVGWYTADFGSQADSDNRGNYFWLTYWTAYLFDY